MDNHLRYIDALRGVAFLGVLTVHVMQVVKGVPGEGFLATGRYGVQLFFLVSTVTLLMSVAARRTTEARPWRNFYIRRLFRIGPLFWIAALLYNWLDHDRPQPGLPDGLYGWQVLLTMFFLHGWHPSTVNSVVPGGWSIAMEVAFYLLLPLLVRFVRSLRAACVVAFASLILSCCIRPLAQSALLAAMPDADMEYIGAFLYFWLPAQLPVFLMGFVVYFAMFSSPVRECLGNDRWSILLWCVVGYLMIAMVSVRSPLLPGHILFALAFGVWILLLSLKTRPLLVNRLTCFLGVISYSCYLSHFLAIRVMALISSKMWFVELFGQLGPIFNYAAVWAGALVITVFVSAFTYRLIEQPGMRLGRLLILRLEQDSLPNRVS